MIPLIYLATVELPQLLVEDEFSWTGVDAEVAKTLGGNLLIWEQSKTGKPLTLAGGSDYGWMKRGTLKELLALASVPNVIYSLAYYDPSAFIAVGDPAGLLKGYSVRFRHEEGNVIEGKHIVGRVVPDDDDYYNDIKIKLMEVSQ